MKAPPRLVDPRSNCPESLRDLIRVGRSDLPDARRVDRLGERLSQVLAGVPAGGVAASGAAGHAVSVAGGAGWASVAKVVAVVAVVAGVGTGVALTSSRPRPMEPKAVPSIAVARPAPLSPSPLTPSGTPGVLPAALGEARETQETAAPSLAATAAPVPSALAPTVSALRPEMRAASAAEPAVAPPVVDAPWRSGAGSTTTPPPYGVPSTGRGRESEVELLEEAQDALSTRAADALALADEHAARFPAGALGQEREVIAIEALARLHREADAQARAHRFVQLFPTSAHRPRIDAVLAAMRDASPHNL